MVAPVTPPRINTPLRNYFFYKLGEKTGQVLADGYLIFYTESTYPTGYLTVYQDPDLTIPYETTAQGHVGLGDDGGIAPIYMQDIAYAIECYSFEGDLQFTVRNYLGALFLEGGGGGGDAKTPNLFPDGQFNFPIFNGSPPAAVTPITSTDWVFERNGSGGTDILEFIRFPLGDTDVVQTPLNMLHYQVTSAASGETVKRFYFPFRYVRTLETQQVTISFYARGTGSSTITPFYEQYFGSGGTSPSVTNTVPLAPISLTGTWVEYQQTFTIETASGKTLGTNDNDQLRVGINFTLNGLTNVFATNMLLEEGDTATQYPYITDNEIESSQNSVNPPGLIGEFGRYSAPVGWLVCDGTAYARNLYIDLFEATSITLNGDTTNASNIVNNVNTTQLAGGSYITQSGTTISGMATITGIDTTQLLVGMRVSNANFASLVTISSKDSDTQVTVTGGTATTSSAVDTDFYYNLGTQFTSTQFTGVTSILKKINSTSFKASANATASGTTGILFCAYGAGDGTTTFNVPNAQTRVLVGAGGADFTILSNGIGAYGGSQTNKMTIAELVAHTHGTWRDAGSQGVSGSGLPVVNNADPQAPTASTGSGAPSNIIQPSLTALICIKT